MSLVILFLLLPSLLFACICEYPTLDEQMKVSRAVFTGKVLETEPQTDGTLLLKFSVTRSWKGKLSQNVSLFTHEKEKECGYPFITGLEYLVYATGEKSLTVSLCSRTKAIKDAGDDLKRLNNSDPDVPARDPFAEMTGEKIPSYPKNQTPPKALTVTNAVIAGIMKRENEYTALVRATDNRIYSLKVGDKLHDGVVLKITDNTVTFRQYKGYRSYLVKKELRPFKDVE